MLLGLVQVSLWAKRRFFRLAEPAMVAATHEPGSGAAATPAAATGSDEEILASFRRVKDELRIRLNHLLGREMATGP